MTNRLTVCYGKSPCLMGKLPISIANFHSQVNLYTRGYWICQQYLSKDAKITGVDLKINLRTSDRLKHSQIFAKVGKQCTRFCRCILHTDMQICIKIVGYGYVPHFIHWLSTISSIPIRMTKLGGKSKLSHAQIQSTSLV